MHHRREFEDLLLPELGVAARLAFGMLQDRSEAEDAVQEAALKAWRRKETFRGGPFRPWFLGIVANQCRTVRRSRWWGIVRLAEISSGPAHDDPTPGADLRRALMRLPAGQRAALVMHFYLDLPLDEVGLALGLSTVGAKSRVNRGLRRLRPMLTLDEKEEAHGSA